jgi:hypothetical protein
MLERCSVEMKLFSFKLPTISGPHIHLSVNLSACLLNLIAQAALAIQSSGGAAVGVDSVFVDDEARELVTTSFECVSGGAVVVCARKGDGASLLRGEMKSAGDSRQVCWDARIRNLLLLTSEGGPAGAMQALDMLATRQSSR